MKDLTNQVAAITGAASGIGRETAIMLAREGCGLAIADRDEKGLGETARLAAREGIRISRHIVDVADRDAVYRFADEVLKEHGKATIVVNNAGVSLTAFIDATSDEDIEWIMNINFWGVVHGTRAFLPHLRKAGKGRIVNVSSVLGLIAVPSQAGYCASKFAVRGFTETLQMELELSDADIRAVCVHPGGIKTNIVRNSRLKNTAGQAPDREKLEATFDRIARTTAREAAARIVSAIKNDRSRLLIGIDARLIDWMQRLFPRFYRSLILGSDRNFREMRMKNRSRK